MKLDFKTKADKGFITLLDSFAERRIINMKINKATKIVAIILALFFLVSPFNGVCNASKSQGHISTICLKDSNKLIVNNETKLQCVEDQKHQSGLWKFESVDGIYCVIKNKKTNKVLEVDTENTSHVKLAKENKEHTNQLWYILLVAEDTYKIKEKKSGSCLQYEENNRNEQLSLSEETNVNTQNWCIDKGIYEYTNKTLNDIADNDPNIMSSEDSIVCNKLNEERAKLCADFEKNSDKIKEIDKKLEELGEKEVDDSELQRLSAIEGKEQVPSKAKSVPNINDFKRNGVKATSQKQVYVYNGSTYEIQTILQKPTNDSSPLVKDYGFSLIKSGGFKAGARNVAKASVANVLSLVPEIGGPLSKGYTVYSYAKAFLSGFKTSTEVITIKCNYTIQVKTNIKHVFVKSYGASDKNYAISYRGNIAYADTQITTPVFEAKGQKTKFLNDTFSDKYASPMYSGCWDYACRSYKDYTYNHIQNQWQFYLTGYKLILVDQKTKSISIPLI